MAMLRLYDYLESGNGYKVRLLLTQLRLPFERVEVDILAGQSRTPAFLALNPNGRIPVLRLEDGTHLAESNAIQWYLAEGTRFLPDDRRGRAEVLRWMFFEQYSHEPFIAVLRFWQFSGMLADRSPDEIAAKRAGGVAALDVLERRLAEAPFLVGDRYGIADIALFAYTHVAGEGGFDLGPYPGVRAWIERVEAEPDHVGIEAPTGVAVPLADAG